MRITTRILLVIFLIYSFGINSQVQIGDAINGEASLELLGSATAISDDGSIIAVGVERNDSNGTDSGKVRVFNKIDGNWIQLGNDIYGSTQGGYFGNCVSLSADGKILAVGAARSTSHVQVFEYDGSNWVQLGEDFIRKPNDYGPIAVSLSNNGKRIVLGKPSNSETGNGQVRVYEYDGSDWIQLGQDINGEPTGSNTVEFFGYSVSLSGDGNRLLVGAPGTGLGIGKARAFQFVDINWVQMGNDIQWNSQGDRVGTSVSMSDNGTRIVYGAPRNLDSNAGHVRILDFIGTEWQTNKIFSLNVSSYNHKYGNSVSLSANGTRIAIGDPLYSVGLNDKYGLIELYNYDSLSKSWVQLGSNILGENAWEEFGFSAVLSADGNTLIGGAIKNDSNGLDAQGQVRIFDINFNTLFSVISFDAQGNGCQSSSVLANSIKIKITKGAGEIISFTGVSGLSKALVQEGTFFVSPILNDPRFIVSPVSEEVIFNGLTETRTVNFCVSNNEIINDVSVDLIPAEQARPGFESKYRIYYQNLGTEIENGNLVVQFDDIQQAYVEGTQTPDLMTSSSLTYNYSKLQPFESRYIDVILKTNAPPVVNSDDILLLKATISLTGLDSNLNNNEFELNQLVVNSFDPNDKQVVQGNEITIDEIGEYLHYIIRFQNTGTASAINVRVRDVLEDKLDWDTFLPISSSHDYYTTISNGNVVDFNFDNIQLPAEQHDEPNSHGFVAFKIKPQNNVDVGDIITGKANIYFDYNEPIITNIVSTEIVDNSLGIGGKELIDSFRIYPNPTNDIIYLSSKNGTIIEKVEVYSISGKLLFQNKEITNKVDLKCFPKGMYFLNIVSDKGSVTKKIIKK
ncbi:DUF7619 domain-containing protein [Aestuariivivens insulae]|uniref:DUF7619 domain-containing protein n=1 Tax=Aestuariivivens insulae TaxID=1621988 RepID=UPI001F5A2FFB|nr:T9SS type A sorting domain-containing protein [Aestuariivivens insulae]